MWRYVSLDYFDTEANFKTWRFLGKFWSYKEAHFIFLSRFNHDGYKRCDILKKCHSYYLPQLQPVICYSIKRKCNFLKNDVLSFDISRESAVKMNCVSRQHDKEHVLYFSDYPALQVRTTTESNNHIRVRVSSTLNPRQQPGY